MRVIRTEILSASPNVEGSDEFKTAIQEIESAIGDVVWPDGSSKFTVYPVKQANGVKPIKDRFMARLETHGWQTEVRAEVGVTAKRPGKIDVVRSMQDGRLFAVEWETGNISSSHRALNKMVIGMQRKKLLAGVLILPTRKLYNYLTDRVGNYEELAPYFDVWRAIKLDGVLAVIAIEHDDTSHSVEHIPKGTDGRAKV